MALPLQLSHEPRLMLTMRPSAELVTFAQLIAMPEPELEARVAQELDANPALIRVEPEPETRALVRDRDADWTFPVAGLARETTDEVDRDPAQPTVADELIAHARASVGRGLRWLVEIVVGELDDHGYLRRPTAEVADDAGVSAAAVETVIAVLREVGPCDIAAADVRASLLLQLDRMEPTPARDLARTIVRDDLDLLGTSRGVRMLARRMGIGEDAVREAADLIRRRCRPRPMSGLWDPVSNTAGDTRPDIVVVASSDGSGDLHVRLGRSIRATVAVDEGYRAASAQHDHASPEIAGDHLGVHLRRADSFLAILAERESTLLRVARHVVAIQAGFARCGDAAAVPLTRSRVAADLGLHESTISRAVADKVVLVPSGRAVAFDRFFGGSIAVVDALRTLIASEDRPRSDAELVASLGALGYRIARRTVAKYRHQLGIPPTVERQLQGRMGGEPTFA